jgi:hypothetical protein
MNSLRHGLASAFGEAATEPALDLDALSDRLTRIEGENGSNLIPPTSSVIYADWQHWIATRSAAFRRCEREDETRPTGYFGRTNPIFDAMLTDYPAWTTSFGLRPKSRALR